MSDKFVLWDVGGTLTIPKYSSFERSLMTLKKAQIPQTQISLENILKAGIEFREKKLTWKTHKEEQDGYIELATTMLNNKYNPDNRNIRLAEELSYYAQYYKPVDKIDILLKKIGELNIKQGIVSDWPPSLGEYLNFHDLHKYFDFVVASSSYNITKPNLEFFKIALNYSGSNPSNIIYIGNHKDLDIIPAQSLGMNTIHFDPRKRENNADAFNVEELSKKLQNLLGKEIDFKEGL